MLLTTCIYQVVCDSSEVYIDYEIKNELLVEMNPNKKDLQKENTKKTTNSYDEPSAVNNYSISDVINKFEETPDYFKEGFIAVVILLCAYDSFSQCNFI